MNEKIEKCDKVIQSNKKFEEKKSYFKPTLTEMGSMQRVTLGGSEICNDSGQGAGTGRDCP